MEAKKGARAAWADHKGESERTKKLFGDFKKVGEKKGMKVDTKEEKEEKKGLERK